MGQKLGGLLIFISVFALAFFAMSVSVENPAWDFLLVGLGLFSIGFLILRKTHKKRESNRFRTARKILAKRKSYYEDDENDGYENYEDI